MKDFTLWLFSFFTPFLAESFLNIIKVSTPEIVAGENPAISPIILFVLLYFLITFISFTITLARDNVVKCKKPGWAVVIKRNLMTSFFLTLVFGLIINIPLKTGISGLANKALESQMGGLASFQELEVERIVGSMMPFINGVIMTPFVLSSIMVGNAMTRAQVCKDDNEYPKLPMGLTTLPHYSSLSTLPEDNVNLRQKVIPREETTRNNVYRVCWSDLVKKKEPIRHFSKDECRGWNCKVSGDTCGGTPERPLFTCVNQPNPGLCKDPPCWFGNDGNRNKFDEELEEDPKMKNLKGNKKNNQKENKKNESFHSIKGEIKYDNYSVDTTENERECYMECKKSNICSGFTYNTETKNCNLKNINNPDSKGREFIITPDTNSIFRSAIMLDSEDVTAEMKYSKCPDNWEYVGDGRCKADDNNRGICDEVVSFDIYSDNQKKDWAKKCAVSWTKKIPVKTQKTKNVKINGASKSNLALVDDSNDQDPAAIIYSKEEFTGNKLVIPLGGSHCPDLEEQNPDILWDYTKDKRICEGPNNTNFAGGKFGSIKLHPDYQITIWSKPDFRTGIVPPITVKNNSNDLQYDAGPAGSYVVCKKNEVDNKGNCKKPRY